jgi:diacylglycerol O-acyltransferase / trehalose O-mycolyltransferase
MYHDDKIRVVAEHFPDPHVIDIDIRSDALDRTVTARLLTPYGWAPDTDRTWPTLYLLHGGDATPSCWTDFTDIATRALADDVLVVLPPAGRAGFYTDWRSPDHHGTTPHWERFHLRELRSLVEGRYGGGTVRAAAGVSMGGYGALVYAARNPGLFAAIASYSGMLHVTRLGTPSLLRLYLRTVDERLGAMWGARLREDKRWRDNDPYHLADRLAGTPLYLSAGDGTRVPGDEPAPGDRLLERLIGPGTRDLATRLAELGCPARTSFGPGTHYWPSWQRELERSWPFLTAALGRGRAAPGRTVREL